MTQTEYNALNESWIDYKEEQIDELLSAADEYEHDESQPETNLT